MLWRKKGKKKIGIHRNLISIVLLETHWRTAGTTTPRTGGIGLNESLLYLADLLTTPAPKARVSFI